MFHKVCANMVKYKFICRLITFCVHSPIKKAIFATLNLNPKNRKCNILLIRDGNGLAANLKINSNYIS